VRRKSFEAMNCSVAQTLEVVGEWWSMLIVRDLFLGVTRFDDFQSRLGISRNVLTERLEHLMSRGVVERRAYQDRPLRYDYVLTEKGRDLWLVLAAMRQWGDRWEAPDGAPVVALHQACDHPIDVIGACEHCGVQVERSDYRLVPGPGARPERPPAPVPVSAS
jgi:DNA-binding HxlR family transcriptional regulator